MANALASSREEHDATMIELRKRLAADKMSPQRALSGLSGYEAEVSRSGVRVRITLNALGPKQLEEAVQPMLAWLCARSCGDQRVIVEDR